MSVALTGNLSQRELTALAEDVLVKRLKAVNGVAAADIKGGAEREIQILLDSRQMSAYGLTTPEVLNSLRNENIDAPGGKVTDGRRETSLRTVANMAAVNQLLDIPVGQRDGVQLYVKNIAAVKDTTQETASVTKVNGQAALGVDIMKQSGSNTVKVAKDVAAQLGSIKKELPAGVDLVVVRDNSKTIKESVEDYCEIHDKVYRNNFDCFDFSLVQQPCSNSCKKHTVAKSNSDRNIFRAISNTNSSEN